MDIKIDKDILHLEKFPKEIKASFPVQTTVNYMWHKIILYSMTI